MKYLVTLGFLATLLGGCAELERMDREADQRACDRFGFKQGTDAYANCMMQQAAKRDAETQRSLDRQKWDESRRKR